MYPTRLYLFWNTIPSLKIPSYCECIIAEYDSYNWTRQNWLNANLSFKNLQNAQNAQNTFSTFCWWRRSIWRQWFGSEAWRELRLCSLINSYLWEWRDLSTTRSAEGWETGWEWETVDHGMMQYAVYAVLRVNSGSWHGEIVRDDLSSCS